MGYKGAFPYAYTYKQTRVRFYIMLTIESLQAVCKTQNGKQQSVIFAALLAEIMPLWAINTPQRQAMFIAQVLHESGEFRYLAELGNDKYLSKYDTGTLAKRLGNTPEADGDGQLYKGRGLIQITGRYNYQQCGHALQLPLLKRPELLENPRHAVASACWFWADKKLNRFADNNQITACTRVINGGTNGLKERIDYWRKLRLAFGIA